MVALCECFPGAFLKCKCACECCDFGSGSAVVPVSFVEECGCPRLRFPSEFGRILKKKKTKLN